MHKTKSGFTIVELLIVIVVIGILAAITIVAYNGIQTRSKNAQTYQGMADYQKGFMAYAAINGAYPVGIGCLGEGVGTCWQGGAFSENASLHTALKTVMSTLPKFASGSGTPAYLDVAYGWTVKGQPRAFMGYLVLGPNPVCGWGQIVNSAELTNATTYPYSGATSSGNECWVPLPAL